MKYLFSISLLFFSVIAFGQDLIVTTAGDSLKCKIVEVSAAEIQFRFGTGGIISIPRNEVGSYRYNFESAAPTDPTSRNAPARNVDPVYETPVYATPQEKESASKSSENYPPFFTALVLGGSSFGSLSTDTYDLDSEGVAFVFGLDFAYFFTKWLGAGLKLYAMNGDVTYTYTYQGQTFDLMTCTDRVLFYGPALYGRWGKNKFAFTASAGVGGLNWRLTDPVIGGSNYDDTSASSFGGFFSAGVNYMFTRHFGLCFNIQSLLGSIENENEGITRHSAGLGVNLGVNIRF